MVSQLLGENQYIKFNFMRIIQILALMLIFVSNSNAEDNDFKNENLDKLLKEFSKKDALLTNIITICDKSKCIIGSGIDFVPIEHSIKGSKGEVILRIFIPNEKNSEEKGHNLYDSYITFTVTPSFRVTVKEDSGSIIKKLLANPLLPR